MSALTLGRKNAGKGYMPFVAKLEKEHWLNAFEGYFAVKRYWLKAGGEYYDSA